MGKSPGLEEEWVKLLKEYIKHPDEPDELVWEVTIELLDQELSRMRPGKCARADKLVAEVLKELPHEAKEALALHFDYLIWDREVDWPEFWKEALLFFFPRREIGAGTKSNGP